MILLEGKGRFRFPPQSTEVMAPLVLSARAAVPHLQWEVPGDIDVAFVLIQPDFGHPQRIAFHCGTQVCQVRLHVSLNVGDLGARYDFDASATQPHLPHA